MKTSPQLILFILVIGVFMAAPLQQARASGLPEDLAGFASDPGGSHVLVTKYPSDDAKINQRNPGGNYGASTVLQTRNNDGGGSSDWGLDSLLKFDLSSLPIGCTIESAELKLYYYRWKDNNPAGRALNCYRATSNWNEGTVTWSSQPDYASQITASTAVPSSYNWMIWDVTDDVQGFVDNDFSHFGWKITDENYWGGANIPICYFYAKEYGGSKPVLVVEYSTGGGGGSGAYLENFDSDLGLEWSTYCSAPQYGRNERTTFNTHSGRYSWRMDVTDNGHTNLNELILHVTVSGASYLNLTFYTREYNDEQRLMPSSFTGHANGDGIAVSQNGTNWETLWQYPGAVSSWTQYSPPDIGSEISIAGDVYIKFQQYDNYKLTTDGILWDDISLETDGTISYDPGFVLPEWGGAMVHSDKHLTDYMNLPTPGLPLGSEWSTYSSTTYGRNKESTNSNYVHAGEYGWRMDVTTNGHSNLNELILHVTVSDASYLYLDFYTKEYNDERHMMPSSFTGHANGDGIAVSQDGNYWITLWQYPGTVSSWTPYNPPNIGSLISIAGDVYIKFQQYDNYALTTDGILWDDITLASNGTITLEPGRTVNTYTEGFEFVAWFKDDYASEQSQNLGNGVAGNGKIAACPFASIHQHNLIVYDYEGNRIWKSGYLLNTFATTSTPLVSGDDKVIMCDNHKVVMIDPYNNDDGECVWLRWFPSGPYDPVFSPTLTQNGVIILPTGNGDIQAIDLEGNYLGEYELGSGYSVMNSACVHGNRVYVLADKLLSDSRLYAIDVDPDGTLFTERWHFNYDGKSQASPTYIDGVLYFDIYQSILTPELDVGVCAVEDRGSSGHQEWMRLDRDRMTWFSMTADPRGDSIWYENTYHKKLVRLSLADGSEMETIYLYELMGSNDYKPISVMQICGDPSDPVMIVSANDPWEACYVICIDLEGGGNNTLLWKYRINSQWDANYAGGQYTILLDDEGHNPRIVLDAYWGGVYALGK